MKPSTPTNCVQGSSVPGPTCSHASLAQCAKSPNHQPLPHSCPSAPANLAVQTEQQQHEEEQGSPEWGHRHQCDSPWIGNEG